MKIHTIVILAFLLAFSGCTSNNLLEATSTPIPTNTATYIPTLTPSPAPTFTPTFTPTMTLVPTPAPISLENAGSLILLRTYYGNVQGFDWMPKLVFSPDFKTYTTHFNDHTLILWDANTGKQVNTLADHTAQIWDTAFSPDGRLLASSDDNGIIILWDATSGQKLREMTRPVLSAKTIFGIAFSPDSKTIVASTNDVERTLVLFNADTGEYLRTLQCDGYCSYPVFSPDGKFFAHKDTDPYGNQNKIVIRDATGKRVSALSGNVGRLMSIAFSPNGEMLASSNELGSIYFWDVNSGKLIETFDDVSRKTGIEIGENGPFALAFSPDGSILATGYGGGSIILWDVKTTSPVFVFRGQSSINDNNPILSIAFSADGTLLASTTKQNSGTVWTISTLSTGASLSTPIPQTPSIVLLDISGSYPETDAVPSRYTADGYSFSAGAGTYVVELNTDDNTNICYLVWQVRPSSSDPNSPASWYGDSNFPGSLTITQAGDYVMSVGRARYSNKCQAFTYTLRITKP